MYDANMCFEQAILLYSFLLKSDYYFDCCCRFAFKSLLLFVTHVNHLMVYSLKCTTNCHRFNTDENTGTYPRNMEFSRNGKYQRFATSKLREKVQDKVMKTGCSVKIAETSIPIAEICLFQSPRFCPRPSHFGGSAKYPRIFTLATFTV